MNNSEKAVLVTSIVILLMLFVLPTTLYFVSFSIGMYLIMKTGRMLPAFRKAKTAHLNLLFLMLAMRAALFIFIPMSIGYVISVLADVESISPVLNAGMSLSVVWLMFMIASLCGACTTGSRIFFFREYVDGMAEILFKSEKPNAAQE